MKIIKLKLFLPVVLLAAFLYSVHVTEATAAQSGRLLADMDNTNPMIVGRNLVITESWLDQEYLSKQQLTDWLYKLDRVYDSYVELIGRKPFNGKINVILRYDKLARFRYLGLSGRTSFIFNSAANGFSRMLEDIARHRSWDMVAMHEMAHIFSGSRRWGAHVESITDIFIAYAMETAGAEYGSAAADFGVPDLEKTSGDQHRRRRYTAALDSYLNNRIKLAGRGGIFDLYLLGLVDIVGWEAYKTAFRSYAESYHKIDARDFLNKLAKGRPDALRSLPDKGSLLDKYFPERE